MRNFTKLTLLALTGLTAITSAAVRQKSSKVQTQDFEWIDGDLEEPLPMFYVGDDVLIYNPYEGGFYAEGIGDLAPTKYEITDVKYDVEESVYRYQLKNGLTTDWYSEDWLSLPVHTTFIRELVAEDCGKDYGDTSEGRDYVMGEEERDLTTKLSELERKLLDQQLDELTRDFTIDLCLDRITHGTAEQKEEAERVLTELTEVAELSREKPEGEA